MKRPVGLSNEDCGFSAPGKGQKSKWWLLTQLPVLNPLLLQQGNDLRRHEDGGWDTS